MNRKHRVVFEKHVDDSSYKARFINRFTIKEILTSMHDSVQSGIARSSYAMASSVVLACMYLCLI